MNESTTTTMLPEVGSSLSESDQNYIDNLKLIDDVISVTLILLTGFGLVGNALVYATVQHLQKSPQFRNSSLTYLKWLAFADASRLVICDQPEINTQAHKTTDQMKHKKYLI